MAPLEDTKAPVQEDVVADTQESSPAQEDQPQAEAAPEAPAKEEKPAIVVTEEGSDFVLGIDLGSSTCVLSAMKKGEADVLPFVLHNPLGDLDFLSIISLGDSQRLFGRDAFSQLTLHPNNTFYDLKSLLASEGQTGASLTPRFPAKQEGDDCTVQCPPAFVASLQAHKGDEDSNDSVSVSVVTLIASLLAKYATYAETDVLFWQFRKRIVEKVKEVTFQADDKRIRQCVISVPSSFSEAQRQRIREAAAIAGLELLGMTDDGTAMAATYMAYHRETAAAPTTSEDAKDSTKAEEKTETEDEGEEEKAFACPPTNGDLYAFVDMGSRFLDVMVARVNQKAVNVLSRSSVPVGVSVFEARISKHMLSVFREKYAKSPHTIPETLSARSRARLERAVLKAIKVLSTTASAAVEVDSLTSELDAQASIERSLMESLCAEELSLIRSTVSSALAAAGYVAGEEAIKVEVVGGGIRIPCVQKEIRAAAGVDQLHFNLDGNSSVAMGAALFASFVACRSCLPEDSDAFFILENGEEVVATVVSVSEERQPTVTYASTLLGQMAKMDDEAQRLSVTRNDFEQYLYTTQELVHESGSKDEECKKEGDGVLAAVTAALQWLLYSDEGDSASLKEVEEKVKETKDKVEEAGPKFVTYVREKEEAKKEAERKAAEEAKNMKTTKRNKLRDPKTPKEKLEASQKRKEQGSALFKELNYEDAISRYRQALKLADEVAGEKFVDDVKVVKLSCFLNLAVCQMKLKKPKLAEENCTLALRQDPESKKGIFQRGKAKMEQKKYEEAIEDFKALLALDATQKAATRQIALAQKAIAKRKANEKKMYQKMFGQI